MTHPFVFKPSLGKILKLGLGQVLPLNFFGIVLSTFDLRAE